MSVNPVNGPVLEAIANRWSPYRFDPREVEDEKLCVCLEAARWAANSFNDQPWSWLIARRQDGDEFQRMIGCLMEGNRPWAENAGALLLSVCRTSFEHNGKPNRVALHDLGQAAAHMALQATAVGLQVHQMAGVNLSLMRQEYGIPEGFEPQTALAIGYPDTSKPVSEQEMEWSRRESGSRQRKALSEITFAGKWGNSADFLAPKH
jgi:nitroreductase